MRLRIAAGLVAAVLGVTLVTSACSKGEGTVTIDGKEANDHGSTDIAGDSTLEIEADNDGSDYYFSPTVVDATAGQTILVELKNEGDVDHNFTIDSLGISQDVGPGETVDVEVTLPQSGNVTFYCAFHEGSGMLGEFTIS